MDTGSDRGADDDFHLQADSPALDAGDPDSYYLAETWPNSGRADLGTYGHSPAATPSHSHLVQLLSPNGFEKWEVGQPHPVLWRRAGFSSTRVVAQINFADHESTGAGQRLFDIALQSALVAPGFDIYTAGGGRHKAVVTALGVSATAGSGILLELVNRTDQPATLSAIEILAANPNPTSNVKASLELSTDNGANWAPAAADLPMDVADNGEFLWTLGQNLAGQTALLRVRVAIGALFLDSSNAPFLIVNGGRDYYVNDAAFAPNDWTTAVGNNANSGKDFAHPVAGLFALFTAYDLDPTDVIHVDAGRYAVPRNLVLGVEDSGVRIVGYHEAQFQERFSLLERGNTVEGSYLFQLRDASNVTLDWLRLTGAETAIRVADDSASHGLTVRHSTIYGNQTDGIYLGYAATGAVLADNSIFGIKGGPTTDDQAHGIVADSNKVYSNGVGIEAEGRFIGQIINNIVYANTEQGVLVSGGTAERPVTILNNTVIQSTGDAVRLEPGVEKVRLQNNILTIESGYALHLTGNEAVVLESDYNLFRKSTAANAHLVSSGGTDFDTLTQWQAAAQKDGHSLVADPLFVEPDGADNVLGYRAANGGYDGGVDDNFVLNAGSPAIASASPAATASITWWRVTPDAPVWPPPTRWTFF